MGLRVRGHRPHVPVEIADVVEKWARKYGRHARITFIEAVEPPIPQVRITPRANDPVAEKVQTGELPPEAAEETVELMRPDPEGGGYTPYRLEELGASGVLRILQKTNTWSGRGEFDSLEEAGEEARKRNQQNRRDAYEDGKDETLAAGRSVRRQALGIPLKEVGIDLEGAPQDVPPEPEGD